MMTMMIITVIFFTFSFTTLCDLNFNQSRCGAQRVSVEIHKLIIVFLVF